MTDLLDEVTEKVAEIVYTAVYPVALEVAESLPTSRLAAVIAGDDDVLTEATADAAYDSRLEDWIHTRGVARRIRKLFDLTESFEESGIGWERGITLSQVKAAELADLIVWEIEHGAGPVTDAWCNGRRRAEVDAARAVIVKRV